MSSELFNIDPDDFNSNIFEVFSKKWLLLTAGELANNNFNMMTVSWGFMGTLWGKPCVMTVVRPQRHTMKFLEEFNTFTLTAFDQSHKDILAYCGANSGKECDKIAGSKLTPIESHLVSAPTYAEAELTIECHTLYMGKFFGKNFLDKSLIKQNYPNSDFHNTIFAEVKNISGISKYRKDSEDK